MAKTKKQTIRTRRWREEDIPAIVACQRAAYPNFAEKDLCHPRHYKMQLAAFPEGQVLAECDGEVVGYAASLIVQLDDDSPWHSYMEITGDGTFSTHTPSGDTLYGADIAVHPDYRGKGVAAKLYSERKKVMRRFNLRRMVAGGRIPGYSKYAGRMTPEEYIERVKSGELRDMALTAHLKAGYEVRGVHMDYLSDEASLNYATFIEMKNPEYKPERRKIAAAPIRKPVRKVRVCLAQYEMRRVRNWEEFEQQVEFFVTTADEYHCHFLVFPELFTAQLFSMMDKTLDAIEAVKRLADMGDRFREMMKGMAKRTGIFIIGGSHPAPVGDELRNVSWLFTPSGNVYSQEKLHITPSERESWGLQPGEDLKLFDTGLARIGIQVCYDIEFPETSRLLTLAGAEIIFVPFSTDERRAYQRIRFCSQGRAIENAIYVCLTGNVGNLSNVESFLINYGQAVVCTPSDFAFPSSAIAAEADPNAETVIIADLDLGALSQEREMGSVTQLRDRRFDLYAIQAKSPVKIIRTV